MYTNEINAMIDFLNTRMKAHYDKCTAESKNGADFSAFKNFYYDIDQGRKYTKIFRHEACGSRNIVMFIDPEGNIYKPAGWKAPAKGIRGHITDWKKACNLPDDSPLVFVNYNR